jgi:hypothetical protein
LFHIPYFGPPPHAITRTPCWSLPSHSLCHGIFVDRLGTPPGWFGAGTSPGWFGAGGQSNTDRDSDKGPRERRNPSAPQPSRLPAQCRMRHRQGIRQGLSEVASPAADRDADRGLCARTSGTRSSCSRAGTLATGGANRLPAEGPARRACSSTVHLFQHHDGGVLTGGRNSEPEARRSELVVPSYSQPRQWKLASVLASSGTRASTGAATSSTLSCAMPVVALPDGRQHRRTGLSALGSGLAGGGIDCSPPCTPSARPAFDRGVVHRTGVVFSFAIGFGPWRSPRAPVGP